MFPTNFIRCSHYSEAGFLVRFMVLVCTKGLMIGSYSAYQKTHSELVIQLSDEFGVKLKNLLKTATGAIGDVI